MVYVLQDLVYRQRKHLISLIKNIEQKFKSNLYALNFEKICFLGLYLVQIRHPGLESTFKVALLRYIFHGKYFILKPICSKNLY